MARKPNYSQDRRERERKKALRREEREKAKQLRAQDRKDGAIEGEDADDAAQAAPSDGARD